MLYEVITNKPKPSERVIIMGAAGRDFHNFNVVYKADTQCQVVAFTAAQIPGISARRYPSVLAGKLYPEGIPIFRITSYNVCYTKLLRAATARYDYEVHQQKL